MQKVQATTLSPAKRQPRSPSQSRCRRSCSLAIALWLAATSQSTIAPGTAASLPSHCPSLHLLHCYSGGIWRMEWAGGPIDGAVQVVHPTFVARDWQQLQPALIPSCVHVCLISHFTQTVRCCRSVIISCRSRHQPITRPHHRSRPPSLRAGGVTRGAALQQRPVTRPVFFILWPAEHLGATQPLSHFPNMKPNPRSKMSQPVACRWAAAVALLSETLCQK